jgi:hypothetical protein
MIDLHVEIQSTERSIDQFKMELEGSKVDLSRAQSSLEEVCIHAKSRCKKELLCTLPK